VSGNTLLGLAAITDAFAILGGRQPTMLAQMAPIAQQRSQQQALDQIIDQRMRGALSPQQATMLGNAVQQAGAAAGGGAPQAAGGEAPYGGGFSARGLAINTQIESGGNATAQNPRSSAFGANQFIASTWNEFARANPDLFRGMSQEEILASRSNPELSAQATQWNLGRRARFSFCVQAQPPEWKMLLVLMSCAPIRILRAALLAMLLVSLGGDMPRLR